MPEIRRLIVTLEADLFPIPIADGQPFELGDAFRHTALLAAARKLPLAVAWLHSSEPVHHAPAERTASAQSQTSPVTLTSVRTLIDQQAQLLGTSVCEFEDFTTAEWADLLTSTPSDSGVLLSLTVPAAAANLSPPADHSPLDSGWLAALKHFRGFLWLHPQPHGSPQTPSIDATDVIALVSCQPSPLQGIESAINLTRALHTKFHLLPHRAPAREPAANTTAEQIIYEALVQCDYRTLPRGIRVYPFAESPLELLQQVLQDCPAPVVVLPRTTEHNTVLALLLNSASAFPHGSVLLLPDEHAPSAPAQH